MLLRVLEQLARRSRRPGAHPAWTAVSLAVFLLRRHHRRSRGQEVLLREELKPGESLMISHTTERWG